MAASRAITQLIDTSAPGHRPGCGWWAGVIGMLALILHLAAPTMGQASGGIWIEICAEFGPVMVEVDLDGTAPVDDKPCPRCDSCTLCAAADTGLAGHVQNVLMTVEIASDSPFAASELRLTGVRRLRPETRGPPMAAPNKPQDAGLSPSILFGGAS